MKPYSVKVAYPVGIPLGATVLFIKSDKNIRALTWIISTKHS